MNKKGATVDNFYVMVSFFLLVLFFISLMLFWNGVKDVTGLWDGAYESEIKQDAQQLVDNFDYLLVMAYFGLHLGILVTVMLLRSHPVVYVGAIFLIAILTMVAAPLSNAYEDIVLDTQISAVSGDIPITNFILSKLPMLEVIWGFLTAIILFGLAKFEGFI